MLLALALAWPPDDFLTILGMRRVPRNRNPSAQCLARAEGLD
jgi:hypothetical protein